MNLLKPTETTIDEVIKAYETLGPQGHKLVIDNTQFEPIARCWRNSKRAATGQKKVFAYKFKSEQEMMDYVVTYYNNKIKQIEKDKQVKAQRKSQYIQEAANVKIGDIFCYSWGYEQTNVDYFEVIAKKGKLTIIVRPIAAQSVKQTSWGSDICRPIPHKFVGAPQTVRLSGDCFTRSFGLARKMEDPTQTTHRSWYA